MVRRWLKVASSQNTANAIEAALTPRVVTTASEALAAARPQRHRAQW